MTQLIIDEKLFDALVQGSAASVEALVLLKDHARRFGEYPRRLFPQTARQKFVNAVQRSRTSRQLQQLALSYLERLYADAPLGAAIQPAHVVGMRNQRSDAWCRHLEASLNDDWRCPRIVAAAAHRGDFPATSEVEIQRASGAKETRVIASIEDRNAHDFFLPDVDPWDVRLRYSNNRGLELRALLPRPPDLEGVSLYSLKDAVARLHAQGWKPCVGNHRTPKKNDLFYFLPPEGWDPLHRAGTQMDWRRFRFFDWHAQNSYSGFVDSVGRIWQFDQNGERHWDVQRRGSPKYGVKADVSQHGRILRDPVGGWN